MSGVSLACGKPGNTPRHLIVPKAIYIGTFFFGDSRIELRDQPNSLLNRGGEKTNDNPFDVVDSPEKKEESAHSIIK